MKITSINSNSYLLEVDVDLDELMPNVSTRTHTTITNQIKNNTNIN